MTGGNKLLVYILRRDIRAIDNPIFHNLATADHGFTHLLPVYVLPPHQLEVSGLLKDNEKSPYPPAVSQVGKFWRCGPARTKFITESIWDLKSSLEKLNSGMILRVGSYSDVLTQIVESLKEQNQSVDSVWLTEEPSKEEVDDQNAISSVCSRHGIKFQMWQDEKYFIDDRDTGLDAPKDLPDVFTTYRKSQEPLKERPKSPLPCPEKGSLPTFPPSSWLATDKSPFVVPETYKELEDGLLKPIRNVLSNPPPRPDDSENAHPFKGGETTAWERLRHLISSGAMTAYQETRNGLTGLDYSTKLSAYLALGSVTARSIHDEMVKLEKGEEDAYSRAKGFGRGENEGTRAMRFELLWRDYMRLCTMKFGTKLFKLGGFKGQSKKDEKKWKSPNKSEGQDASAEEVKRIVDRFLEGTTGMGLIDASQRELYHTGYTSNRARQNVASFFSKHLYIDWRYGAEWYEMMLVDYDVSSNWANWQYVAGVGNDPRGDARIFNPVKQAFDYDNNGTYVRMWVPEVKYIEKLENVFQVWTTEEEELEKYDITNSIMVTDPIKKIDFQVDRKPRAPRRPYRWRRGSGRGGGRRGGGGNGHGNGNGNGHSNGHGNGHGNGHSNGHGNNDYSNNMGGGHFHGGPPSPENDRHFYNGDGNGYHQNSSHYNGGWSQNRGGNSWRGNVSNRGNMGFMRDGGFPRYPTNNYGGHPQQYMATPAYHLQQYPPPYHHQLPPHLAHAM